MPDPDPAALIRLDVQDIADASPDRPESCTYCGHPGATRISSDPYYEGCVFCSEFCEAGQVAFDHATFQLALEKAQADDECVFTGEPIYSCICRACTGDPDS